MAEVLENSSKLRISSVNRHHNTGGWEKSLIDIYDLEILSPLSSVTTKVLM